MKKFMKEEEWSQEDTWRFIGRKILGYLETGIQTLMAQCWSTKIISMIKWIRTSRLSIKNSPSTWRSAVSSPPPPLGGTESESGVAGDGCGVSTVLGDVISTHGATTAGSYIRSVT